MKSPSKALIDGSYKANDHSNEAAIQAIIKAVEEIIKAGEEINERLYKLEGILGEHLRSEKPL